MNRPDKSEELFRKGYNCSQSVFAAFADVLGMSVEEAAGIASPFGAGFGKLREVCGAVSGMTLLAKRSAARRCNKHIFTWVFSFLLGIYGVDRFARGQIGLGLLKMLTFGGFGFWYLADVVVAALQSYAGTARDQEDLEFDIFGRYI